MWKSVGTLLLVLGSVTAFKRTWHINNETDHAIPFVNQILTDKGLGLFQFPALPDESVRYPGVHFGPGVQLGLNTLYRRGDATLVTYRNGTSYYDFPLGFRLFALGFGQLTWNFVDMAGLLRMRDSEIHVSYWVHNSTKSCRVQLDRYTLTELDGTTLYSSEPSADDLNASYLTRNYILGKINLNMVAQRKFVERGLEEEICAADGARAKEYARLKL